jgi:hypothetical protein
VVFVVVGEEREHRILVLHLAVDHGLIPGDHLGELARSVDHMDEAGGANARHRRMFPSFGVPISAFFAAIATGFRDRWAFPLASCTP